MRKSRINPVSAKQARKNRERKPVRDAYMAAHPWCQAERAGAPGPCFGPLECHEPLTKARGGPQDDPRNYRSVCSRHNTAISQDVETMRWAYEHGFLVHAWDGAAWLAAGGRGA